MADEDVIKALDCTYIWPGDGSSVEHGRQETFQRHVIRLVEEETGFDPHQDKMTMGTMVAEMWEFILDLAERINDEPNLDPVQEFHRLKPNFLRDTIGSDLVTYTIYFPLNLLRFGEPGISFSTPEATIERITREEWKEKERIAREDDSFTRFIDRESPHDFEPDVFGNETFTFWTADYAARDVYYASYAVQSAVNLFIAKVNFVHHRRERAPPSPGGTTRPGYLRWSPLRRPFTYLMFNGSHYVDYHISDFDYRRRSLFGIESKIDYIERLEELPEIQATIDREHHEDNKDVRLYDAFLAYQNGISASTKQQSFFSFWRGIERLCHVDRDQPGGVVVDRSRSLFEARSQDDYVPQEEYEALDDLSERRNDIAHTGPHISVQNQHRNVIKRMLDKLIDLHIEYYGEFDVRDFRTYLDRNTKPTESNLERINTNRAQNRVIRQLLFDRMEDSSGSLYLKKEEVD